MLRKLKFKKPEDEYNDLGLGTKFSSQRQRMLNRDGSFNINRKGVGLLNSFSFYHEVIQMSWTKFNVWIVFLYVVINTFFALIYLALGINQLTIESGTSIENFWNAFFFSGQALTTVGFGRISPIGWGASIIATIESLLGLLGFALITGSLYGRFSRPTANILFSTGAVIAPYKNINAFMFRLINQRKNQLIDLEIQVMFSRLDEKDGQPFRRYYELNLERKRVNFFPIAWTVVHPIDENSPFFGVNSEDLKEADAEIMIMLKAYDDSFSQHVHTRASYDYFEIKWGAKFKSMFINNPGEVTAIDMNLLHKTVEAKLNNTSNNQSTSNAG